MRVQGYIAINCLMHTKLTNNVPFVVFIPYELSVPAAAQFKSRCFAHHFTANVSGRTLKVSQKAYSQNK